MSPGNEKRDINNILCLIHKDQDLVRMSRLLDWEPDTDPDRDMTPDREKDQELNPDRKPDRE